MLTVLATPDENKVLLDANNTVIRIQSTNGAGFYFRALISIDDDLFDTQGWSRSDAYTAEKDLKKLYNAYFASIFNASIANGLTEQTHLIKKVSIVINEYDITDDTITQTETLPDFYIMYNQNPVSFTDATKVQLLGLDPEVMQIPLSAKLSIPFFVNADAENVTAKLTDGVTDFHSVTAASVTGKKAYLYTVDLSAISIPDTQEWLSLVISCGASSLTKTYKVFLLPNYEVKTLAFRNNFGFFIRAYFDGDLEIVDTYKGDFYETLDGVEKPFEISEDAVYTLNTGSLLVDEKQLIPQICNSLDAHLLYNGEWLQLTNKSKRYREFADNNWTFEEDMVFNISKNKNVANTGIGPLGWDVTVPQLLELDEGASDTIHATLVRPVGSHTYLWEVIGDVAGVTLSNETTATVTVEVSDDYLDANEETFSVRCTVTDSESVTKYAETIVSVADVVVVPFSIDIPESLEITEGYSEDVHADLTEEGSGTYTWLWEVLSNTTGVTLVNEDTQDVTVEIAGDYTSTNGETLLLQCTATNEDELSASDTMSITILEHIPFSVEIQEVSGLGPDGIEVHAEIIEPGEETYTYLWTFEGAHVGMTLDDETTDTVTVNIDPETSPESVTLRCTATNSLSHSEYDIRTFIL